MGSKIYTETTAVNRPQTFGAQDSGIIASDSRVDIVRNISNVSNVREIDEGAVASAFDFARGAFENATDTVEKSMALVGITNEPRNVESIERTIAGSPISSSIGSNLPMILMVGLGVLFMFWKLR